MKDANCILITSDDAGCSL